ncbi:hypothetical protein JTE90_002040 [Oedothorax gibbosus]|uniref:Craniofacial development protein 1 n=1 Tax=Oedothorax gibbosus TaxID=931172 RepID=A0AAV6UNP7_9ARAC|nr:hypothetical protein JTE90_002040 [Oedothorax gibbosus]
MAEIHSLSSDEEDGDYVPDDEEIRRAEIELSRNKTMMSSDCDVKDHSVSVVDDKDKAEELWKDFLSDEVNASSSENANSSKASPSDETSASQNLPNNTDLDSKSGTTRQDDGESSIEVKDLPQSVTNLPKKRGLGSFLSQVSQNKKPKMNMLQKSLKDWESFKQDEGISEDLQTFNKGKRGFLERQAFLSRSDLRSFEVEKSMRLSNKKK